MNEEAADLWTRALRALKTAQGWIDEDPDAAASRAYYAAFYAVSAHFATEGRTHGKHSAVHAAVHRDLVKTGRIPPEAGAAYSYLADLRSTGDYGGPVHVSKQQATEAVAKARGIVAFVRRISGEQFPEDTT